ALPFADGEFDVVTSSAGVIFAPDHQAAADELVRVCRPGGTIGLLTFTPEGSAGEFFELFGRYAPPVDQPPILWGVESHVRELFGNRLSLRITRDTYVERTPGGPEGMVDFYKTTFGPIVATYARLDDAARAELDRAFVEFISRGDRGAADAEVPVEYLLVVGRKR
ncbi:MAG TPA: methyltransferase domain-containing protein, partial [Solirubrobacteraceae bacterium]|nr:methyltransferase domain-containing protein [Solirubrobacteraceae bacterium]